MRAHTHKAEARSGKKLIYGSFAPEERDVMEFPSFYRMVPNETLQYSGIIQLLLHFGWTWVGLFAIDDDSGEHFVQELETLFSQNGLCLDFTERIPSLARWDTLREVNDLITKVYQPFIPSKANTFIIYGGHCTIVSINIAMFFEDPGYEDNSLYQKVWIMTAQADFIKPSELPDLSFSLFQGALSFTVRTSELLGFKELLQNINPYQTLGNNFLRLFWEQAFDCILPNSSEPVQLNQPCTGQERLESLPGHVFEMGISGHSYSIYNGVYAVAYALHALFSSRAKHTAMLGHRRDTNTGIQPWEVRLHHV